VGKAMNVSFEVMTMVIVKMPVFWDVAPSRPVDFAKLSEDFLPPYFEVVTDYT
jgi:hypothetical protein